MILCTDSKDVLAAHNVCSANAKIMREPAITSTSKFPVTDISKIAFKDARSKARRENSFININHAGTHRICIYCSWLG